MFTCLFQVSILTEDGIEHVGFVYTVDPVSETYILANFDSEKTKIDLIMSHAVSSVNIVSEITDTHRQQLDRLFRPAAEKDLSEDDLKRRQSIVKAWLLKNRLPVEVGGTHGELLTIAEALVIQPPYGHDNCVSTNEIILGKIQGLIKNMPVDQEQW